MHSAHSLHLWFTHDLPTAPDLQKMQSLAAAAECLLGVAATARNWRTVTRIAALAGIADT